MPRVDTPVYNATKAAVRSFTISLRHQLRGTSVRVVEMVPPAVQSELHDFQGPSGREVTGYRVEFTCTPLRLLGHYCWPGAVSCPR